MQATRIGNFEVHRGAEFKGPFTAPEKFFSDFDAEALQSRPQIAQPWLIDPATGKLIAS